MSAVDESVCLEHRVHIRIRAIRLLWRLQGCVGCTSATTGLTPSHPSAMARSRPLRDGPGEGPAGTERGSNFKSKLLGSTSATPPGLQLPLSGPCPTLDVTGVSVQAAE